MNEKKFPALFIGHGSPMNIIADNNYTRSLQKLSASFPRPKAILVVSAHWLTHGTAVTGNTAPEQMYDFYGFPDELYGVEYNAPGSPDTARQVVDFSAPERVSIDPTRGIDHAAWAILMHLFPDQSVPVLELSLDLDRPAADHFAFGRKLARLREEEVLVIGSGNIVHNLRQISFDDDTPPFPWAVEFDSVVKDRLLKRNDDDLIDYMSLGINAGRAVPTPDHYLPLLYVLGMRSDNDTMDFICEDIQNGSVSMRSFILH